MIARPEHQGGGDGQDDGEWSVTSPRTRRAVAALIGGASATEAAHVAGFHDSSHLTRTFKELIALNPSALSRLRNRVHMEVGEDPPPD